MDNGYQPTNPMTPEEIANPPKGGSGLPPYNFIGPFMLGGKHVTLKVPNLNLGMGAIVTLEGTKYVVVKVLEDGVRLERKND